MLNLHHTLELTSEQERIIRGFGDLTPDHWNKNPDMLRLPIREKLRTFQNDFCVYCGCPVYEKEDVEHIAHKSKYPQFIFTPKNLAYSCKTCNQTYKKQVDIISALDAEYEKCTFSIVHPYLDDVDHFFDTSKIVITIRPGLTPTEEAKANKTSTLLHWREPPVISRRASAAMVQHYCTDNNTSIVQTLLEDTLTYKPGCL